MEIELKSLHFPSICPTHCIILPQVPPTYQTATFILYQRDGKRLSLKLRVIHIYLKLLK